MNTFVPEKELNNILYKIPISVPVFPYRKNNSEILNMLKQTIIHSIIHPKTCVCQERVNQDTLHQKLICTLLTA